MSGRRLGWLLGAMLALGALVGGMPSADSQQNSAETIETLDFIWHRPPVDVGGTP